MILNANPTGNKSQMIPSKDFFKNLPSYIHRCLNLNYILFYLQKKYIHSLPQEHHQKVVEDFLLKNPEIYEIVSLELEILREHIEDSPLTFFENKIFKINRDLHWDYSSKDPRLLVFLKTKRSGLEDFLYSLDRIKPQTLKDYDIYIPNFWRPVKEYKQFRYVKISKVIQKKNFTGPSFLGQKTTPD